MAATSLANPCVSARTETTSRSISSSIRKHLHQSRQFIPARRPIPPPGRHLRQNYGQFRRSGLPEFIRAPTAKQCSHSRKPQCRRPKQHLPNRGGAEVAPGRNTTHSHLPPPPTPPHPPHQPT